MNYYDMTEEQITELCKQRIRERKKKNERKWNFVAFVLMAMNVVLMVYSLGCY